MQYINCLTTDIEKQPKPTQKETIYVTKDNLLDILTSLSIENRDKLTKILGLDIPQYDDKLSLNSKNAVQNKTITKKLEDKLESKDLSPVAFSGSFSDLECKPSKLPNPKPLIIRTNSDTKTYDGSEQVELNVTEGMDSSAIQQLQKDIAELQSYHQASLTISVTPSTFSKLEVLHSFNLSWSINKQDYKNSTIIVNGKQYSTNSNNITITDNFTDNVYIKVSISNGTSTITKDTSIFAIYPIFYGTSSNYINNDQKLYSTTGQFTVTANNNNYIYIMSPKEITFFVNGFEGGFEELQSITIKDNTNKDIQYFVYKSDNPNLGQTLVKWQQK